MSRAWKQWGLLAVGSVGLVGSMAMLLAIASRHLFRLDLTPEKAYTLAEHSRRVVRGLESNAHVIAFLRSEDPRNRDIEDLLWRVRALSPRFAYRIVDINRNPSVARHFGVSSDAALVVESEGRRKVVSNPDERLLIGALLQVTRAGRPRVYFLTGHGERSVDDVDRRQGFSRARLALLDELYEVVALPLLAQAEVPEDAAVVVIAGPRADLLPSELAALSRYLERGGGLLVLLDPGEAANLAAFLRAYGVRVGDGVVVDPENRLFAGDQLTMTITGLSRQQPVSAALEAPPLFAQARPVEVAGEQDGGLVAAPLLSSGRASWHSRDPQAASTGTATFDAGRDARGPLTVAVSVLVQSAARPAAPARMIVIGDSDFANNFFIEYLGNKDLLVNVVNWLAREERLIGVRPAQQQPGVNQFFVSARQGRLAFWLGAVVQPAILLAIGLAVFLRRRFVG